ncbi:hypothetical protein JS565_20670 [Salmonella enterica subsp. enterica serovar Senftenberg]|nr:hypothetical protein [Salmonella enterica subsp. enterica serovar Senftenberg]
MSTLDTAILSLIGENNISEDQNATFRGMEAADTKNHRPEDENRRLKQILLTSIWNVGR